jgi:hypothetical protein
MRSIIVVGAFIAISSMVPLSSQQRGPEAEAEA